MRLAAIHVYPVKSATGISPEAWPVDAFGLAGDRRWMVIDGDGDFVSQRDLPALARIKTQLFPDGVLLNAPDAEPFLLRRSQQASADVTVWRDTVAAALVDGGADAWLSGALGEPGLRIVYMPDDTVRQADTTYAAEGDRVSFADGFPFLLASAAALDHLNAKLDTPVTMSRFRPNLVVEGAEPHAEDGWKRVRIGGIEFDVVKPCGRCQMVTVDPTVGARDGKEPLRTLSTYRRTASGEVTFGQNLVHRGHGTLHVGDEVEVLEVGRQV